MQGNFQLSPNCTRQVHIDINRDYSENWVNSYYRTLDSMEQENEERTGNNVRGMVNVWLLTFAYVWVQLNELWNLHHMPNRPRFQMDDFRLPGPQPEFSLRTGIDDVHWTVNGQRERKSVLCNL